MMYAEWNKHATPAGLSREFFVAGLKSIGVSDVSVEQAWDLWTEMVKETVDYRDFGCALSTVIKGTIDDLTACTLVSVSLRSCLITASQSSSGSTRRARASFHKLTWRKSSALFTCSETGRRAIRSLESVRVLPALRRSHPTAGMSEMFPTASDRLTEEEWKRGIAAQNTFLMCLLAPQQRPHQVA